MSTQRNEASRTRQGASQEQRFATTMLRIVDRSRPLRRVVSGASCFFSVCPFAGGVNRSCVEEYSIAVVVAVPGDSVNERVLDTREWPRKPDFSPDLGVSDHGLFGEANSSHRSPRPIDSQGAWAATYKS